MNEQYKTLFPSLRQAHDMRMLLDRLLVPEQAHPLVRDLLEGIRECGFGEAQIAMSMIKNQLGMDHGVLQTHLAQLLFSNAAHAPEPFTAFQYLMESGFSPAGCASDLMEHLALGQYFQDKLKSVRLLTWLLDHGGLIEPDSKAAWKALEANFPDVFSINHSHYESRKLDAYIRSQALEVREVARL